MLKESNSPRLSTLVSTYFSFYFRSLASAEHWDEQYKAGDWDGLRSDPSQMGHHMVVLGYTLRAGSNPRILDVGCGSGGWLEYIQRAGMPYERYLGIDVSTEGIELARPLADARTEFAVCADGATYTPTERYDAIVFNEVVWYFKNPGEVLARYAQHLTDRGVLIVSLYQLMSALPRWWSIDRHFHTVDKVQVQSQFHKWQIRLLAPGSRPLPASG